MENITQYILYIIIGFESLLIYFMVENIQKLKQLNIDKKNKQVNLKNRSIQDSLKAKELFDSLLKNKFDFYLYKEILPKYVGSEEYKKEKIKKDDFQELKEKFFLDIKQTISKELFNHLMYLMSPVGLELYVHQQFSIYFNKIDMKFFNNDEKPSEKDLFFMTGKDQDTLKH